MSSLDASDVRSSLSEHVAAQLDELETFASIDSTNTYLLARPAPASGRFCVAIADEQTSGRGRHSRRWESPPEAGLYLSIAYTLATDPGQLPALTLALGVGVTEALGRLDIGGVQLKWPNDIIALDGKLGGILTEVAGATRDGVTVVAGIGLNISLPASMELENQSGWVPRPVDLSSMVAQVPERARLATAIIEALHATIDRFGAQGFSAFVEPWRQRDWLLGQEVIADMPGGKIVGKAAGVDNDGALIVDTPTGPIRVVSGSIELPGMAESA